MAQLNRGEYEKDQEVEIYDVSQKRWILCRIHDILDNEDEKIYCVEYEEYSREIRETDAKSLIRIPHKDNQSTDNDARKKLLNCSKDIAPKLSVPQQIQLLSETLQSSPVQRMSYLYMNNHLHSRFQTT